RPGRPAGEPVGRRDRRRAPAGLLGGTADDAARPPLRRASRGPVRADRDVHRHRHGRLGDLGEPAVDRRRGRRRGRRHERSRRGERAMTTPEFPNEVVTRALVRLVDVPGLGADGGPGRAALITLDNGYDHTKPNTFGPAGLASLDAAIDEALAAGPRMIAVTG